MSTTPVYTIIVSGERFKFTRDQLETEPGNYFATYFLGDFAEAAQGINELTIEKEPKLFTIIQAHLRGYDVLPLADSFIPPYMTQTTALNNLSIEAQYYGLDRLFSLIEGYRVTVPPPSTSPRYLLTKLTDNGSRTEYDLQQEAYQALLQRVATNPNVKIGSAKHTRFLKPAYELILSWVERAWDDDPYFLHYALLRLKD